MRPTGHVEETRRARFEAAARAAIDRAVGRTLANDLAYDSPAARSRCRAVREVAEMIRDVQAAADAESPLGKASCPLTYHLLRTLDAGECDLSSRDTDGPVVAGRAVTDVRTDIAKDIKEHTAQVAKIRAALRDHDPRIHRERDDLDRELESEQLVIDGLKQLSKIRPDQNHRRAAALCMLMHMHQFATERELADFISQSHAWHKPPCPGFAADDPYEKIRQIMSRARR